ncbi:MAG: peptidase S41, partial [Muribaculaceae bacterium]|nr:peptidase S41 [Muribaculaceae bacterium]
MKKILSFLGISGVLFGAAIAQNQFPAAQKLRMAEAAVAQLYVDTINEDKLVEAAIKGMLEGLDPHSQYA